jgi:hypothetical protein
MNKMKNNLSKRQKAFLERLAQSRSDLLAVIDGLDVNTLTTEPVIGDWTVKDVLGHLVSWNDEFRSNIKAILAGQHPGYDHQISIKNDFNNSNQLWIKRKRGWKYERIRADIDRDYEEAVALILNLQPGDFRKRGVTPWKTAAIQRPAELSRDDTDSVETLVTYHWRHTNSHIRDLQVWRVNRGNR